MECLLDDNEGHPNKRKNNQKLFTGKQHVCFSLRKSEWKPRQQHYLTFPIEGKFHQNRLTSPHDGC